MKKTIVLLIAFLALAYGGYYLVQNSQESGVSSLDLSDRDFNVKDLDALGKITLEMPEYGMMTLEKKKGRWHINDRYFVGKPQLKNLFNTISRLSINYIPNRKALPRINQDMKELGIHVSIYDKSNKLLKGYTVGASDQKETGTFILMDGASQPYAMELLQFEGSVRGRFFMNELSWRDRTVLSEDVSDIAAITVEYPKQKNISFKLDVTNEIVSPMFKYAMKATTKPRTGSITAYLRAFEKVVAEYINPNETDGSARDEGDLFCKISIDHIEKEDTEIKFYAIASGQLNKTSQAKQEQADKIERYFAVCSWGETYLVQQRLVGKVFRPIEFFYEVKEGE